MQLFENVNDRMHRHIKEITTLQHRATRFEAKNKKVEELQQKVSLIESAMSCTKSIENDLLKKLQQQVQCGVVTGHKFVYQKEASPNYKLYGITYYSYSKNAGWMFNKSYCDEFVFKCQYCSLEIRKTKKQLTTTEIVALRELGIIKAEKKKKK